MLSRLLTHLLIQLQVMVNSLHLFSAAVVVVFIFARLLCVTVYWSTATQKADNKKEWHFIVWKHGTLHGISTPQWRPNLTELHETCLRNYNFGVLRAWEESFDQNNIWVGFMDQRTSTLIPGLPGKMGIPGISGFIPEHCTVAMNHVIHLICQWAYNVDILRRCWK